MPRKAPGTALGTAPGTAPGTTGDGAPRKGGGKATRKPLPEFGVRGVLGTKGTKDRPSTRVRAVVARGKVTVLWTEGAVRHKESRPDTEENREWARGFGQGVYDTLRERAAALASGTAPAVRDTGPAPIALAELWRRYLTAHPKLRRTTVRNYTQRWDKLTAFAGRDTLAHTLTREQLDEWVVALYEDHDPNQVREIVKTAVRVIRFGVERDLLPTTKVITYRVKLARGEGPRRIPEYTRDEARKILAQFDPRTPLGWRPYVATYLFALTGARQNAGRHFTWDDVDLGRVEWHPVDPARPDGPRAPRFVGVRVFYRAELDKMGEARWQPVPSGVAEALYVALGWRAAYRYAGPFILFRPALGSGEFDARSGRVVQRARAAAVEGAADQPYSYDAYRRRLHAAERASGVAVIEYRAAHSFRRLVLNDALEATGGNLTLAAQFIGDRDLSVVARSYARTREDQMRRVADALADMPNLERGNDAAGR